MLDGEDLVEDVADRGGVHGEDGAGLRGTQGEPVTGGTRVLSDWLVLKVAVNPGEAFIDRMIAMVEGARRQKTPNEIALTILLVALTIVFLVVTVTLLPFSLYSVAAGTLVVPRIGPGGGTWLTTRPTGAWRMPSRRSESYSSRRSPPNRSASAARTARKPEWMDSRTARSSTTVTCHGWLSPTLGATAKTSSSRSMVSRATGVGWK